MFWIHGYMKLLNCSVWGGRKRERERKEIHSHISYLYWKICIFKSLFILFYNGDQFHKILSQKKWKCFARVVHHYYHSHIYNVVYRMLVSKLEWKNKNDNNLNIKLKYNDDFSLFCSVCFFESIIFLLPKWIEIWQSQSSNYNIIFIT